MASQQLRTITRVLRSPGAMRGLAQFTDWLDVLALLDTCRTTRVAFARDPDAILAAFVPAFNRLAPLKDGESTIRIDIEQWVLFSTYIPRVSGHTLTDTRCLFSVSVTSWLL